MMDINFYKHIYHQIEYLFHYSLFFFKSPSILLNNTI